MHTSLFRYTRTVRSFLLLNSKIIITCLPFGLCTSPFVFTKILNPVLKYLRERGFISVAYLDDILCITASYEDCVKNVPETIQLWKYLDFIINMKKSKLTPSKFCKYLGFVLDTERCLLILTKKKKTNLINKFIILESCNIKKFAQLLGKLVIACPAIKYEWLYTKLLEYEKVKALEKSLGNYKTKMACIK